MTILNRLRRTLERTFVNVGRARAREYLLRQDDRVLADSGFSRELLEQGNRFWPWRVDGTDSGDAVWSRSASPGLASTMSMPAGTTPALDESAIADGTDRAARKAA